MGDDDDESADGEEAENGEAAAENGEKEKNGEEPAATEDKDEKAESDVEGGEKEGEDKSAQDAEEEDDPSNLQLAWEMLELAKVVYTKTVETEKDNSEVGRRLCETYMVLGEVSLENENYPQAVEDLELCLARRLAMHRRDPLPAWHCTGLRHEVGRGRGQPGGCYQGSGDEGVQPQVVHRIAGRVQEGRRSLHQGEGSVGA